MKFAIAWLLLAPVCILAGPSAATVQFRGKPQWIAVYSGAGPRKGPVLFLPGDGSRLKARWFETPDHQRSFAGWYDSQLGTSCAVRAWLLWLRARLPLSLRPTVRSKASRSQA